MIHLTFADTGRRLRTVLCIGAHADDIEIGCGGTILKLLAQHPDLRVDWVVLSADPTRAAEARRSAKLFLRGARRAKVAVEGFSDSRFPQESGQVKEYFESLKATAPDLIFTHYRHDLHQDHRLASELTWNSFRSHFILEYEVPKYDGDLGRPNVYVDLSDRVCRRKIRNLMTCYASQQKKHWFTEDTFLAFLRLRGIETGGPGRYAEAFYGWKMVL